MNVIRLPNGNLLVPESAISSDGRVMSDAYVEIEPSDAEYERLAAGALSQQEMAERRQRWREGDETLRRQFLDFLARHGHPGHGHPGQEAAGSDGHEDAGGHDREDADDRPAPG